jgi:hypothetical protein
MNKCLRLVHLTRRHGAVGVRINIRVFQQSWNYSIHGHNGVFQDQSAPVLSADSGGQAGTSEISTNPKVDRHPNNGFSEKESWEECCQQSRRLIRYNSCPQRSIKGESRSWFVDSCRLALGSFSLLWRVSLKGLSWK